MNTAPKESFPYEQQEGLCSFLHRFARITDLFWISFIYLHLQNPPFLLSVFKGSLTHLRSFFVMERLFSSLNWQKLVHARRAVSHTAASSCHGVLSLHHLAEVRFSYHAGWHAAICDGVCSSLSACCSRTPQEPWGPNSYFSSAQVPWNCPVLKRASWLCKLKKSLAAMNLSLTYLDPAQAQLAEWFSGRISFPIHIYSYKVSFPHSNVLISLKCFTSIFLLQCHFLKISMFPWKTWSVSKIHSQLENTLRRCHSAPLQRGYVHWLRSEKNLSLLNLFISPVFILHGKRLLTVG